MAGKIRQQIKLISPAERFLQLVIIISLSIFILWPVISVLAQSFIYQGRFSLRAYQGLFTKNYALVINSFALALCVALVSVVISTFIAVRLAYKDSTDNKIIIMLLALSSISPPFLCSMAYLMLFMESLRISRGLVNGISFCDRLDFVNDCSFTEKY